MMYRNLICVAFLFVGSGFFRGTALAHTQIEKKSPQITSLMGMWLTDDRQAVVLIKECAEAHRQYCGYLVGFEPSGEKLVDRALCGARIVGGLTPKKDKLVSGWVSDTEENNVYNVEFKLHDLSTVQAPVLEMKAYGKIKALNEKVQWTRFHDLPQGSTLKMCA